MCDVRSYDDLRNAFKGDICTHFRAYVLVPLLRKAPWITIGNFT